MTEQDSTQIWNRRCPTPREFPQQNWLISVQALLNYKFVETAFAGSCKIHTCLSRVRTSCTWLLLICSVSGNNWKFRAQCTKAYCQSYKKHNFAVNGYNAKLVE